MFTVSMAADHPCLAGHFPGWPVVPGAWLVEQALANIASTVTPALALHSVRFLSPVRPGEQLSSHTESRASRQSVTLRRTGEPVLVASFQPPAGMQRPTVDTRRGVELPGQVANRGVKPEHAYRHLPHSGDMRWLSAIEQFDKTGLLATSHHHRTSGPLHDDAGNLSISYSLELAAQCCAIHGQLGRTADPKSSAEQAKRSAPALLMGAQKCRFYCNSLSDIPADIAIRIELLLAQDQQALYQATLFNADSGEVLAELRLALQIS